MDVSGPSKQPDIDELAREKVDEIEQALGKSQSLRLNVFNSWLSVLKQIITAADLHRTNDKSCQQDIPNKSDRDTDESIYADYADDNEQFNTVDLTEQFASHSVKWTIRVKAFKLVHRLVRESMSLKISHLKLLPDLVRLSFVAATSPYDDLKMQGFEMFKFLVEKFASIEEREFPGHSILEQYRSQYVSAIKPAFVTDSPPYITAIASQVCSLWICNGLEKEPGNLRRTFQMMEMTIEKLRNQSVNQNSKLYTESELEQERLDILGSWAQLYIISKPSPIVHSQVQPVKELQITNLSPMINPHMPFLINGWWEALKDYALLIMPAIKNINTSHDNHHVYTREVALKLFDPIWARLVLALSMQLACKDCKMTNGDLESCDNKTVDEKKYFKFLCGIIMKELTGQQVISQKNYTFSPLSENTIQSIKSLAILVKSQELSRVLADDLLMAQEFHSILHWLLVRRTRQDNWDHKVIKSLISSIFKAIVVKMGARVGDLKYGVAHCIVELNKNLNLLKNMNKTDTERAQIRLDTWVLIRYQVSLLNVSHRYIIDDDRLQRAICESFGPLIELESDLDLGLELLSLLAKESDNFSCWPNVEILTVLFKSQLSVVSKLMKSIVEDGNLINQLPNMISKYYHYIKLIIPRSESAFVKMFLKSMVDLISILTREIEGSSRSIANQLVKFILNEIKELETKHHDQFNEALESDLKNILDLAKSQQQKIEQKIQQKNTTSIDKTRTNQKTQGKLPAKIVLKADFSNYLTKS